jgi:hypothetical protein
MSSSQLTLMYRLGSRMHDNRRKGAFPAGVGERLTTSAGWRPIARSDKRLASVAGVVMLPGSSQDEAPERDVDTRGTRLTPEHAPKGIPGGCF